MINSKRLSLRPIGLKDSKAVFEYRSDSETNKYQSWIPKSIEDVKEFIKKNPKNFNKQNTWFQLVVFENELDKIIGDIGVHFVDEFQCEIGITMCRKEQGKGYAKEALKALLDHLFNDLNKHRVYASVDPRNFSSINLVSSVGFRKEAHFRQSYYQNGQWHDDMIYAVLKAEWYYISK